LNARSPIPAMMQPTTTNMTEHVKVGLGQDFFHTDCRRQDKTLWTCYSSHPYWTRGQWGKPYGVTVP
jgi:hypothetical protein